MRSAARRTESRPPRTHHLFSTPEDVDAMINKLGLTERGRYLVAATFGNVHGVYKPGNVGAHARRSCASCRTRPSR